MNLAAPLTQKAESRPISFLLDRGTGAPKVVSLVIRPEDLTVSDPSRISVQQTLSTDGGAWADNFGPGLQTINISGHTGWRRRESDGTDGETRFRELNDQVFTAWHDARKSQALIGFNPDGVQLIFADSLDNIAAVVAPMNFTLRRSRQRPLLCQFQISLTVLQKDIGAAFGVGGELGYLMRGIGAASSGGVLGAGLESLTASVNRITGMIGTVQNFITANLVNPVKAFLNQTARLYGAVRNAISAATGIVNSLIGVARMTAQAGVNLFRTLAAVANIPNQARAQLMQLAGAYSNILCVLSNALKQKITYPDYSSIYGASNCSSTSGGRPVSSMAGQNPFYAVVPTTAPLPVMVNSAAQAGLSRISGSDPVLAPMSTNDLGAAVRAISSGMQVA